MDPTDYCTLDERGVRFDEARASAFAKGVAGDFNPIHDVGSRRFCVPGDLLFALLLHRYGAREECAVRFASMLDAGVELPLPEAPTVHGESDALHLVDARGREVLGFFRAGEPLADGAFVAALCEEYVRFSGRTFPEILVGLMREAGQMINPERPLVIYKDMVLRIDAARAARLAARARPTLALASNDLAVNGKKGLARLEFVIEAGGERLGAGEKNLVLGALKPFDETAMAAVIADYERRRLRWNRSRPAGMLSSDAARVAGGEGERAL